MRELLAPYDIAKLMQSVGFNERCLTCYKTDKSVFMSDDWAYGMTKEDLTKEWMDCLAPTYEQVMNWLMINHDIKFGIYPCIDDSNSPNEFHLNIYKNNNICFSAISCTNIDYSYFYITLIRICVQPENNLINIK